MTLPAEVLAAGRHNAKRTGIDEADALSFTAQAWAERPDMWRTVAHRRCVEERRRVSGRSGDDHRALAVLDEPAADGDVTRGDLIAGAVDPGIAEVEARITLADTIGALDDTDLAALARRWWLGMPARHNGPGAVAHARALRHARAQAVAQAIRDGKRVAIAPPADDDAFDQGCPLTDTETRVVEAIADGLTFGQAGTRLNLSPDTIRGHMRRISKRLEAQNGVHVVAISLRAKWIA